MLVMNRLIGLLNSRLLKNTFLFSFFSFLNNAIGFFLILLLAKYFSPEEYGYLNLFTTIVTIFSMLISLNTLGYFTISFFTSSKEELKDIINCSIIVSLSVAICFLIIIIVFSGVSYGVIGIEYQYQLIALIICFFQVFNNLKLEIWRLEEHPIQYGIFSLSMVLLNFGLTLFLVIQLKTGDRKSVV